MSSVEWQTDWDFAIDSFRQKLIVEEGLAENTVNSYCSDIDNFKQFTAQTGILPHQVEQQQLAEYLKLCRRGEYSSRTISRRFSSLNRFFSFLEKTGKTKNPLLKLDRPRCREFFPDYLDEGEVKQLLEAIDCETDRGIRDRALLEMIYGCGLRASEAAGLQATAIDWERGELRVRGKGNKQRLVPIGREALDWAERYALNVRPSWISSSGSKFFFITERGLKLSRQKIWYIVKQTALQAGLTDVSPHTLRHSFATHMLSRGADLRSLQDMLGHTDVKTTADIYIHLRDEVKTAHATFHPRGS